MGESEPFSLDGVSHLGPVAGATWRSSGLQLVTSGGKLLHCPGSSPVMGVWSCEPARHDPLPMPTGSEILAAAFKEAAGDAKDASADPILALVFKHLPKLVMLFSSKDGAWKSSGEIHLPSDDMRVGINFHGDDLIVSTASGEIHRRSMTGAPSSMLAAPPSVVGRHFTSACPISETGLVRLGLRQMPSDAGSARAPELIF